MRGVLGESVVYVGYGGVVMVSAYGSIVVLN